MNAQEPVLSEPAEESVTIDAEYTGPQTLTKLRLVIDRYEWIWNDPSLSPYPSDRNEEGTLPGRMKPETFCSLIGVKPGQTFAPLELEKLCLKREKEITASQLFFNISLTVVPNRIDPSRVWILAQIKSGFSLRPYGGAIFAALGDMNFDGNLTVLSASLGANQASLSYGQGNSSAGPFWWMTGADYSNSLLADGPLWHEAGISAYAGSAWLPFSPWLSVRAWKQFGPDSALTAPLGFNASMNLAQTDKADWGDWTFSYGVSGSCDILSYSPGWTFYIQPDLRANVKASTGPLTLALQGSIAFQNERPIQVYSLCLVSDPTRAVRGGFASNDEVFADRALFVNSELRLSDLVAVPAVITTIDLQPYAYFDFAATGYLTQQELFSANIWAAGGGMRLQFDVPVFICLDFRYGWSDSGLGAFSFCVSPGF